MPTPTPIDVATVERGLGRADKDIAEVTAALETLEVNLSSSLETVRKAKHHSREAHQNVSASRNVLRVWKATGTCSCLLLLSVTFSQRIVPVAGSKEPATSAINEASVFDKEYRKGIEAAHSRNYEEALLRYNAALKAHQSLTVMGEKAYAFYCLERNDDAFATCDKMLESAPCSGRAYYIKGLLYKRLHLKAQALEQFNLAVHNGEALGAAQIRILER